jgi:hypothetical protein
MLEKIEVQAIMYSELYLPTPYFFVLVGVHILVNTYSSIILVNHPLYFTWKSITLNILLAQNQKHNYTHIALQLHDWLVPYSYAGCRCHRIEQMPTYERKTFSIDLRKQS